MKKIRANLFVLAALCLTSAIAGAQTLAYPQTAKVSQTDAYFGVNVADPYRWLEDDNSPETAKWVEEQNKLTFGYLEKIPYRQQGSITCFLQTALKFSFEIVGRRCRYTSHNAATGYHWHWQHTTMPLSV